MDVLNELTQVVKRTPKSRVHVTVDRVLVNKLLDALKRNADETSELARAEQVLTYAEFRIFRALFLAGKLVTYDDLLLSADVCNLDTLWVHKRRLTVKLAQHSMGYIDTIRGRGYVYVRPEQAQ